MPQRYAEASQPLWRSGLPRTIRQIRQRSAPSRASGTRPGLPSVLPCSKRRVRTPAQRSRRSPTLRSLLRVPDVICAAPLGRPQHFGGPLPAPGTMTSFSSLLEWLFHHHKDRGQPFLLTWHGPRPEFRRRFPTHELARSAVAGCSDQRDAECKTNDQLSPAGATCVTSCCDDERHARMRSSYCRAPPRLLRRRWHAMLGPLDRLGWLTGLAAGVISHLLRVIG